MTHKVIGTLLTGLIFAPGCSAQTGGEAEDLGSVSQGWTTIAGCSVGENGKCDPDERRCYQNVEEWPDYTRNCFWCEGGDGNITIGPNCTNEDKPGDGRGDGITCKSSTSQDDTHIRDCFWCEDRDGQIVDGGILCTNFDKSDCDEYGDDYCDD